VGMRRVWFRRGLSGGVSRARLSELEDLRRVRCSLYPVASRGNTPEAPTDATERASSLLETSIPRSTVSSRTSRPETDLLVFHCQPYLSTPHTEKHSANISMATALHTHFRYQYFKYCMQTTHVHHSKVSFLNICVLELLLCSCTNAARRGGASFWAN
jgi:hypothetical protein